MATPFGDEIIIIPIPQLTLLSALRLRACPVIMATKFRRSCCGQDTVGMGEGV
jgi:hypothetical protein